MLLDRQTDGLTPISKLKQPACKGLHGNSCVTRCFEKHNHHQFFFGYTYAKNSAKKKQACVSTVEHPKKLQVQESEKVVLQQRLFRHVAQHFVTYSSS